MKLAAIGDIHGFWDEHDTAYFNNSDYNGLLFTGDLGRITGDSGVAAHLSKLTKPAWMVPGNHDGATLLQLGAEIKNKPLLCELAAIGMQRRVNALAKKLLPVDLCSYALKSLDSDLALLVARPHAMGGDRFYFQPYVKKQLGIDSFAASAAKLKTLVDQAPERLIVLSHNGPAGLGDTADAPFGNDFRPEAGDFGEPDVREAIDYARQTGRQVLAVVAGHMHHRNPKTKAVRNTWANDGQTLYINAAKVARISKKDNSRHHVRLVIEQSQVIADAVYVSADGDELRTEPLR